jgi:hypothetical protein
LRRVINQDFLKRACGGERQVDKSVNEWPHEKQGETSSLSREFPLSNKNIKVLNDGVFEKEK